MGKNISGVYCIKNTKNGKCYVGSSKNISKRISWHFCNLKNGKGCNPLIKADYDVFGRESFNSFELKRCKPKDLSKWELYYIKKLKTLNQNFGYNMDNLSHQNTFSEETSNKIRIKAVGRKLSNATKVKISLSHMGVGHTLETRIKLSQQRKGKKFSEERRAMSILILKQIKKIPVHKYDIEGNLIFSYKSLGSAAKDVDGNIGGIKRCINGLSKQYKGFIWKL